MIFGYECWIPPVSLLLLGSGCVYITLTIAPGAEMTPDKKAQHVEIYFLVSEQDPVSYFSYELC